MLTLPPDAALQIATWGILIGWYQLEATWNIHLFRLKVNPLGYKGDSGSYISGSSIQSFFVVWFGLCNFLYQIDKFIPTLTSVGKIKLKKNTRYYKLLNIFWYDGRTQTKVQHQHLLIRTFIWLQQIKRYRRGTPQQQGISSSYTHLNFSLVWTEAGSSVTRNST